MGLVIGQTMWQCITGRPLGTFMLGGNLVTRNGDGGAWIAAPASTGVLGCTAFFATAISNAETASGYSGWFIPSISQLQNPIYTNKSNWESASGLFWSTTVGGTGYCYINMNNGGLGSCYTTNSFYIRAFRCVTY
jgi:hypothetical protein